MKSSIWIAIVLFMLSLMIAGAAAYFSISGLAVLFAAEMMAVIIMASILEAGKLGTTFYLHHFWKELPFWKWALTGMVIILMIITSMGIFGFLSKGHLEQESPAILLQAEIEDINKQIDSHKGVINDYETELQGFRDALARYTELGAVTKGLAAREELSGELAAIRQAISSERTNIRELQQESLELQKEIARIEAELGPIKYVAELFGFDLDNEDGKGQAVRIIIVMLMLAFDPLAILLIMAADWALKQHQQEKRRKEQEEYEKKRQLEEDLYRREQEAIREKEERLEKKRIAREQKKEEMERKREERDNRRQERQDRYDEEKKKLELEKQRIEIEKLKSELEPKVIVSTNESILSNDITIDDVKTDEVKNNNNETIIEDDHDVDDITMEDIAILEGLVNEADRHKPYNDFELKQLESEMNKSYFIKYLLDNEEAFKDFKSLTNDERYARLHNEMRSVINTVENKKKKEKGWLDGSN